MTVDLAASMLVADQPGMDRVLLHRLRREFTPHEIKVAQLPENRHVWQEMREQAMSWPVWVPIDLKGKTDKHGNALENRQKMAYDSEAKILFAGGAAGGGKTGLVIGICLTKAQRALIIRNTALDVKRGIVDDIRNFTNDTEKLSRGDNRWEFTTRDLVIHWTGLSSKDDLSNVQGIAFDHILFDEVPLLDEAMIRYVFTWLRTIDPSVRPRVIFTGNPPMTHQGLWLFEYFAPWIAPNYEGKRAENGELRFYLPTADGSAMRECGADETGEDEIDGFVHTIQPTSRTLVKFFTHHNPYQPDDYISWLAGLPEDEKQSMYYGVWDADLSDQPLQIIPNAHVRLAQSPERWTPTGWMDMDFHRPRNNYSMSAIGVDVGRGGKDPTVITVRWGRWFSKQYVLPKEVSRAGGLAIAMEVLKIRNAADNSDVPVYIDGIGIGATVVDFLKEFIGHFAVAVFANGAAWVIQESTNKKFKNVRAMLWVEKARFLLPSNKLPMAINPNHKLRGQLATARYVVGGKEVQVESKEEIRKRTGNSTDEADSQLLASIGYIVPHHYQVRDLVLENNFDSVNNTDGNKPAPARMDNMIMLGGYDEIMDGDPSTRWMG